MRDSWLENIIKKVDTEQKESVKKTAFDTATLPSKVVGRTTEVEDMLRFLLGFKENHVVPLVSIFGRSGTGKSTLIKYVCNYLPEIKLHFVNLRKAKTVFGGVNLILNSFDHPSLKSAQGMNLAIEKIQQEALKSFDDKTKLLVLALDEFDVLFYDKRGNPSDFVYKLIEMQAELKEKGHLMMIVTISNNVLTDYELDDRVKSRIGNSEVFFRPYKKEDILEILEIRAKDAFSKKIDPKVLEHCANLSYLEHGDARRAIDLLRVASELAVQEKKDISKNHVNAASEKLQRDRIHDVIKTLSYHSKIACLVLARKTYGLEKDGHSTASLFERYKQYVKGEPVSYRRFSDLLKDLENSGIVASATGSRGHKGYKTEYKLLIMPEIVGEAINKEWWEENVVKQKKIGELPYGTVIDKRNPLYRNYAKIKERHDEYW